MRKLRGFMVCPGLFKELQHIWGDHEFLVTGMWSGEGKAVRSRWEVSSRVGAGGSRCARGSAPLFTALTGRHHIPALEEDPKDQRG